jgi:hypothetical protein
MLTDTKPQPDQSASSAAASRRVSIQRWLMAMALIVLCCIPFFRSYEGRDRPVTLEEIYWIGQTYYYHLAFERMDWSHPDWQLLPARENPQLGRCVIGLGLQLNGLSITNVDWLGYYYHIIFKGWGHGREREQRQAVLDRMQPAARDRVVNQDRFEYPVAYATTARAVMLIFGVFAVLIVFVLTSLYNNSVIAFLAALMFSLHPAVVFAYTHVGVDILAIAFSLLTVVHFELIKRCVWRRCSRPGLCRALVCASGGLSLAFAVGSKLNAVVVGFLGEILCLFFAGAFLRRQSSESKDSCTAMLVLLVISLLVFGGSNPVHYLNPVTGLWAGYADQQRNLDIQQEVLPGALKTWNERFSAVATITAFHRVVFVLVVGAFLLGVVETWMAGKPPSIIALWWLLAMVAVTTWLPFARPLYVLPVIAPSLILICSAVERLLQTGMSIIVSRGKIPSLGRP